MWFLLTLSLILSPLCDTHGDVHDLHLSKSEIRFNSENQAFEITVHLFIDDLELALVQYGHNNLKICTDKEDPLTESYISQYIEDHLEISIDGGSQQMQFIGKEASEDLMGVWCYLEITRVTDPKSIYVLIDFFNELYDDQKNILYLNYDDDQQEYFLLHRNKEDAQLSIKS